MSSSVKMRRGARLTKVQFQPWAIPEADSQESIDRNLAASLSAALPGFIIREATKTELGLKDHDDLVEYARLALLARRAELTAGPTKTKVKPHGRGQLHTDGVEAVDKVLNFNVHTTVRGEGDVVLGMPGIEAKALIDAERRVRPGLGTLAVRSKWEKPLHHLALSNETFAELIDPEAVFVGQVGVGDSVVMALESARGPMFHRYDTATEDRAAFITELNRPE